MRAKTSLPEPAVPIDAEDRTIRRQWDILHILAGHTQGVTIAELAERYQVNKKTIRRDLELLQEIFSPFSYHNEAHGRRRYFINELMLRFPVKLDQDELLSLRIGRNLMKPLQGTTFWKGIESSFKKIEQVLDKQTVEYADQIAPCFYPYQSGIINYKLKGRVITVLLNALNQSSVVEITYRSFGSERAKTYEIHPYQFVYFEGMLYLAGYSCKDRDNRFWKIDRFEKAKLKKSRFKKPADFKIESMLSPGECPYATNDEIITAEIHFDAKVARLVQENQQKSFQNITKHRNGSIQVTMKVGQWGIFCRWLFRFGDAAEVISPPELRDYVREEAEKIARRYQKKKA